MFVLNNPFYAGAAIEHLDLSSVASAPEDAPDDAMLRGLLSEEVREISYLQRKLYADDRFSVLLIFQAMDAAGKDSTIRHVFSGVNPAGFQVFAFKKPSADELEHDFLWRTSRKLPERGRIGIFNRSYYEEVLVVRVHPEYLKAQRLPSQDIDETFWKRRFEAIVAQEKHLFNSGTLVLKFFLNVSQGEQARRFLARLDTPEKQWKFCAGDLQESSYWDQYRYAYEQAIMHTSTDEAPWYIIPADNKRYMRWQVARIVRQTLQNLPLQYPQLDASAVQIKDWQRQLKHKLKRAD